MKPYKNKVMDRDDRLIHTIWQSFSEGLAEPAAVFKYQVRHSSAVHSLKVRGSLTVEEVHDRPIDV